MYKLSVLLLHRVHDSLVNALNDNVTLIMPQAITIMYNHVLLIMSAKHQQPEYIKMSPALQVLKLCGNADIS